MGDESRVGGGDGERGDPGLLRVGVGLGGPGGVRGVRFSGTPY